MTGLVEFLRARLDEDERHAHAALGLAGVENEWWPWDVLKSRFPEMSRADARHMARFSPRRMLAEVEAKRRLIALHSPGSWGTDEGVRFRRCAFEDWGEWPCANLRLLALPYADHPDYRDEWKP